MSHSNTVDVRGLACPVPVVRTRNAMKANLPLTVLVSKPDQVDNVARMADRSGWTVTSQSNGDHYVIDLKPGAERSEPVMAPEDLVCNVDEAPGGIASQPLVVIASESMGRGDDALGKLLMKAYVNTISDLECLPKTIVLFNGGVKLAVEGSPVLESLKELETSGVEILVCGTCLEFFGLKASLRTGLVSNMFDIAGTMMDNGVTYLG